MATQNSKPVVGIGVVLVNPEGKILVGKRIGKHAPYYSIFGGSLELGESFEEAAIREAKEETNLDIKSPKVIGIVNNLATFKNEGFHSISIILLTNAYSGELKLMEPTKCESWFWCDPHDLPEPHFEASRKGIDFFLNKTFY